MNQGDIPDFSFGRTADWVRSLPSKRTETITVESLEKELEKRMNQDELKKKYEAWAANEWHKEWSGPRDHPCWTDAMQRVWPLIAELVDCLDSIANNIGDRKNDVDACKQAIEKLNETLGGD